MRILHNTEAMSHAALLLALDDSAGTRYSANEGAAPAWRTAVNAMIQQPFMDVSQTPRSPPLVSTVPEQLLPLERRATL
jgi:hypothetical protein